MSLIDDTCDFCNTEFDPMGNDAAQNVEGKMWCGHCKEFGLWYTQNMSEPERKAAAWDELQATLVLIERDYWNRLWSNNGLSAKALEFQRHMTFLNVEDSRRRICAKYGLESGF